MEIETYGLESFMGAEMIFDDILNNKKGVILTLGFDQICLPYCKARGHGGCFASDGEKEIIISHKEILKNDLDILERYNLKTNKYYSPEKIQNIFGIN